MRKLLTGLMLAGLCWGGSALAAADDVLELGIGGRYMFDSNLYASDNTGVDPFNDTYPLAGDIAMGFGLNLAVGHRFDSRMGPWEFLIKYRFSTTAESDGEFAYLNFSGQTIDRTVTGTLREHDVLMTVRIPASTIPYSIFDLEGLYLDLGAGVSTLSYDYEAVDRNASAVPATVTSIESTIRTRSGMAFGVGVGYARPIAENLELTGRVDFTFSQIQHIKDATGRTIHESPNAHNAFFSIGLIKRFQTRF